MNKMSIRLYISTAFKNVKKVFELKMTCNYYISTALKNTCEHLIYAWMIGNYTLLYSIINEMTGKFYISKEIKNIVDILVNEITHRKIQYILPTIE
jgi:hypothetical protein